MKHLFQILDETFGFLDRPLRRELVSDIDLDGLEPLVERELRLSGNRPARLLGENHS